METYTPLYMPEHLQKLSSSGVINDLQSKGFLVSRGNVLRYQYVMVSLCLKGSARCLYDMKEYKIEKNSLSLIMPGHALTVTNFSKNYTQAWMVIDPSKFSELKLQLDKNYLERIEQNPVIQLSNEQANKLLFLSSVIGDVATWEKEELPNRQRLLETQLILAYELYIAIRRKQDSQWQNDNMSGVLKDFCDLVAMHYKEERNVNFYAQKLGYDPRYFSKIIRAYTGGTTPLEWIGNYVAMQIKKYIEANPRAKIKDVAENFGFPTTANLCRYFKRVTGIYPQEYRKNPML